MKRLSLALVAVLLSALAPNLRAQGPSSTAEVVFDSAKAKEITSGGIAVPAIYLQLKGSVLSLNGHPIDKEGRQTYVAGLVREAKAVYLVVEVDPSSRIGELVAALDDLRGTGVTKVLLRTGT